MNCFVHQGTTVEVAAPYEVHPGSGVLKGALFGIARSWAGAGDAVEISTTGVFEIERDPGQTWQVGDRIYWDDNARRFTTIAENAVLVGLAVAYSDGDARRFGHVKLIGYAA
jgi:predicted RecA/RadA family phage recombinase